MPFANSNFTVTSVGDAKWELVHRLVYEGESETFAVPTGYVTDFASVPRFLHWLISPYGSYTRAAIVHDWLLTNELPEKLLTSRDADGIFRRIMRELEVPFAKRWIMWAAVRLGALVNPKRSYGRQFHKDAFKVIAILLVTAPFLLPGVVGVLISLGFVEVSKVIGRWFS